MLRLYCLLIAGLSACAQENVNLSDLNFPDPQRLNSKRNQVDTTFYYYQQEDGSELVFYQTFDKEGRVICDSTQLYTLVRFYYDSLGLLTKKVVTTNGRYTWIDSLTYNFDRDSLILEQRWTRSNTRYRFYLDEAGKLLQSLEFDDTNTLKDKTRYIYDGNLLKTSIVKVGDGDITQFETNFYYSSNGILDSSALQNNYGHSQSWVYDSLGLLVAEWKNKLKGNVRIIHKMRR